MVVVEHADHDSEETADLRHGCSQKYDTPRSKSRSDLAAAEDFTATQLVKLLRPHVLRGGRWAIDLEAKERLLVRLSSDRKTVTVLEVSREHYRDSSR
jgi:hypothetical protein